MQVTLRYLGKNRIEAGSGSKTIILDKGNEQTFRPTEMLLIALGSCLMYNLENLARDKELLFEDIELVLTDHLHLEENRIAEITITNRGSLSTEAGLDLLNFGAKNAKLLQTVRNSTKIIIETDNNF